VALELSSHVAIVDLASGQTQSVGVDGSPTGVAIPPDSRRAFVTSQGAGTVDVLDLSGPTLVKRIDVGAEPGAAAAHPEGIAADPRRPLVYVAVASRDRIAVVDTNRLEVSQFVDVGRAPSPGTQPVALAVSPKGDTLYAADSGEDAVAAISLRSRSRRARGGAIRGLRAFRLIGRIPTAAYPTGVAVTPDGRRLVWVAAKGLGTGPNLGYDQFAFNSARYGTYTPTALVGRLGVLSRPTDKQARALGATTGAVLQPLGTAPPPLGTPVVGPGGGPSDKIKYVFYIVRENRVYDQIFGTDPRGDGDPKLELFDDNGVPGPTGGVTPNAHKLVRTFPLLDHFYSDSEVSVDGHLITSGADAIDYVQRALHANYGNRGRPSDFADPIAYPPRHFLFDQAAEQGVSFRNYGEGQAGSTDDGRPTYQAVKDNTSPTYQQIASDSGNTGGGGPSVLPLSHFDDFNQDFTRQLATATVPHLNYLTLPARPHARHHARDPNPQVARGQQRPRARPDRAADQRVTDLARGARSSWSRTTRRTVRTTSTLTGCRRS